ncbi:uncharacterized protein METZ01_LOCUS130747, partial [marine metagenome]
SSTSSCTTRPSGTRRPPSRSPGWPRRRPRPPRSVCSGPSTAASSAGRWPPRSARSRPRWEGATWRRCCAHNRPGKS